MFKMACGITNFNISLCCQLDVSDLEIIYSSKEKIADVEKVRVWSKQPYNFF